MGAAVGAGAALALVTFAWTWGNDQAADRQARGERIIRQGDALIAQNDRVIDCTTPGRQCFEESQRRSAQTLGVAFAEMDCRNRRALASLPAPDPTKGPCAGQTPPSVYPGGSP